MSTPDRAASPHKPEVKSKPEVPPRAHLRTTSPSGPEEPYASSVGMVKHIVNKFSSQEAIKDEVHLVNGSEEPTQVRKPPEVKPKPGTAGGLEVVPPLPMKRSRLVKKKSMGGEEAEQGGRSEPDGKEVEAHLTRVAEAETVLQPSAISSHCSDQTCSCVCHLERPGMMLIWVPVETEVDTASATEKADELHSAKNGVKVLKEKAELKVQTASEEEMEPTKENAKAKIKVVSVQSEAAETLEEPPAVAPKTLSLTPKTPFHHTLNVLLADASRRRSDPGPPVVITTCLTNSPKRAPSISPQHSQVEEESIYEVKLPEAGHGSKKTSGVPIFVRQAARRSKPSVSTSEETSDVSLEPPAIPQRVPLNGAHSYHGGSSQHLMTPPTGSPITPRRAPPPPPTTDPRRLSVASTNSLSTGEGSEKNEGEVEEAELSPGTKKFSSIWETQLKDEPLYQTYSDTVITKEIRRQTVNRNISKASADYTLEILNKRGVRTVSESEAAKSSLWQDLERVKNSGVLDGLTREQCKYQESMFEVLTSEVSYLRSLQVLIDHFVNNRELRNTLTVNDKKTLFSNIKKIYDVSTRFRKDLEEHVYKEIVFTDICEIINYHAQHHFPAYIDYVRNQTYQEKIYSNLMKTNEQFAAVIKRLQESPQCQRLPFVSFLLLPFQRITRIKMLIENILKRTGEKTKEEHTASTALTAVSKIIEKCNTEVGKMRQMEELLEISKIIEFNKLKSIPIISETRYLEKKGELQEMSKAKTLVNMRMKFNPVYLFLFNDQLLITSKKSSERYVVLDHTHRSLVHVKRTDVCLAGITYENCFTLVMLENHQGRLMERILKASSETELDRWIAAFPDSAKQDPDNDEVVYQDWDCPQVQCVQQYVAQQADELSLEPTDLINVTRKTNEGWMEGIRLSDGQKGWFPEANIIEITNDHVRRRNLMERYRVCQAASLIRHSKSQ